MQRHDRRSWARRPGLAKQARPSGLVKQAQPSGLAKQARRAAASLTCVLLVAALIDAADAQQRAPAIGTTAAAPGRALNVCHAGSLLAAFTQVEQEFAKEHPDVVVADTSGGSVDLARRFAARSVPCDVFAPADHLDIDVLLKPARLADYTIVFANGRMVLAYMANDPKAAALPVSGAFNPPGSVPAVANRWQETLTASGVRISGAHPFLDPGGYRAHLIFDLAQRHLAIPGLYNALLQHYQVTPADPGGATPALGKDFNFQFTYEHTAAAAAKRDPQYRYATLPSEIDLSGGHSYSSSVTIPGLGTPTSESNVVIQASAVEWGLTIPSNSPNRDTAIAFVAALLGESGRAALIASGPSPLTPARVGRSDAARIPTALKGLVTTR
jgi:ABC-type molybdate transport system substrate-binding protein